jgi:hypothetical protein
VQGIDSFAALTTGLETPVLPRSAARMLNLFYPSRLGMVVRLSPSPLPLGE